jgi:branched-chain amino acid transport system permease protein
MLLVVATAVVLVASKGLHDTAQVTVYGIGAGTYFALGAIGLTLVTSVLKVINFAHGDFLTLGAYVAVGVSSGLGVPLVVGVAAGLAATALLGVGLETVLWRPMRRRGASALPLLLMSIGLAFVIRESIHLVAGSDQRQVRVDVYSSVEIAGIRVGRLNLSLVAIGLAVLVGVGLALRFTTLGKQVRAVSDDRDLAETTGVDTRRVILATWVFAGALAGLAGIFYAASVGSVTPNLGTGLLLSIFAAMVLGGVGNAYGALAGGIVIGLAQEWSTLLVSARWKVGVGFAVLVITLLLRPQGIFGRARTV